MTETSEAVATNLAGSVTEVLTAIILAVKVSMLVIVPPFVPVMVSDATRVTSVAMLTQSIVCSVVSPKAIVTTSSLPGATDHSPPSFVTV